MNTIKVHLELSNGYSLALTLTLLSFHTWHALVWIFRLIKCIIWEVSMSASLTIDFDFSSQVESPLFCSLIDQADEDAIITNPTIWEKKKIRFMYTSFIYRGYTVQKNNKNCKYYVNIALRSVFFFQNQWIFRIFHIDFDLTNSHLGSFKKGHWSWLPFHPSCWCQPCCPANTASDDNLKFAAGPHQYCWMYIS